MASSSTNKGTDPLPPTNNLPMSRLGFGFKGRSIQLAALFYSDGLPLEANSIWRKVIDKIYETHASKLQNKNFAYDGGKTLFTISSLPHDKLEFNVVLDEISSNKFGRNGIPDNTEGTVKFETFKVEIKHVKRIPFSDVETNSPEAFRVLNKVMSVAFELSHAARARLRPTEE